MSQVRFQAWSGARRANVEVVTGWDRPLRHFFMTVWQLGAAHDDDAPIFDNLAEEKYPWGDMTLLDIAYELDRLKVTLPPELIRILEIHRDHNEGNTVVELTG